MKRLFGLLPLLFVAGVHAAPSSPQKLRPVSIGTSTNEAAIKFDFQSVNVAQIISLVYLEALKQPYVIDPAVLRDERLVSFRFDASTGDLKTFWQNFLDSLEISIESRHGVDYVTVKKPVQTTAPALDVLVYHPRYRQVSYLTGLLTPLFTAGSFTVNRTVRAPVSAKSSPSDAPPGSAAAMIDQDSDTLVFQGTQDELAKLNKILPQVDTATGEVVVKAVVYEVTTGNSEGSAFGLALNVLGGKLGLSIGGGSTLADSVSIKSASIDSAFSALSGDTRFKAISTPQVRVKSGAQARFTVGQDVPTLGAVTYSQNGSQPVQSVEYRSSGVILSLSPTVRESTVDMTIDQQISDFAKTETGVNNSPTLTKRQLSTTVSISDGELVLIGGLTQDKNTDTHSGLPFLPQFLHSKNNTGSRTEILLLLQVSKISLESSMR
ncbi:type II secretory pathway protein [Undibacterium sp. FT147W]|uniref:Type II secretory pathway protein n=1 Tax=Undibacterium rivi TaxID=2828729 RepID=A0ABS5GYZ8_9BURK|nr:type II secretory pathway protein [Undibacterium rivi]MBR7791675.1 type II secretory pathway protein [Undibacterium rivi]